MRLIDADNLIEAMKKIETEYENEMACPSWWSALVAISEQPAAYDIGKVVKELEETKETSLELVKLHKFLKKDLQELVNMCFDEAIEIVNQGGVSDDVCEWKQTSTAKYKTSCGYKLEEYFYTNACYCKQCGKKIRIVGD